MTAEQMQEKMDDRRAELASMSRAELERALAEMGAEVHHTPKRTLVHVDGVDYEPAWFDSYCDRVVLVEA